MNNLLVKIAGFKPFVADDLTLCTQQDVIEPPPYMGMTGMGLMVPAQHVILTIKFRDPSNISEKIDAWHNLTVSSFTKKDFKRQIEIEIGNGKKLVIHNAFIQTMASESPPFSIDDRVLEICLVADSYTEGDVTPNKQHPLLFLGNFAGMSEVSICLNRNGLVLEKGMCVFLTEAGYHYIYGDFGWERQAAGYNIGKIPKANIKSLKQLDAEEKILEKKSKKTFLEKTLEKVEKAKDKIDFVHPSDPAHNSVIQESIDMMQQSGMDAMKVNPAFLAGDDLGKGKDKSANVIKFRSYAGVYINPSQAIVENKLPGDFITQKLKKIQKPMPKIEPEPLSKDEIFPRKRVIRRNKS